MSKEIIKCDICKKKSPKAKEIEVYTARYSEEWGHGLFMRWSEYRQHKYKICTSCKRKSGLGVTIVLSTFVAIFIIRNLMSGPITIETFVSILMAILMLIFIPLSSASNLNKKIKKLAIKERLEDYKNIPKHKIPKFSMFSRKEYEFDIERMKM